VGGFFIARIERFTQFRSQAPPNPPLPKWGIMLLKSLFG
jgi:hypothetical protein